MTDAPASTVIPPGLGVLFACLTVQHLPALPDPRIDPLLVISGLLLACLGASPILRKTAWGRVLPCLVAALFAAAWALSCARSALEARLDPALEGQTLHVRGVVTDLPLHSAQGARVVLRVEDCIEPVTTCPTGGRVRLNWPSRAGEPPPEPGQRWVLEVRLRLPHALLNPGLFDAEQRALEDGIAAVGSVRRGKSSTPPEREDAFVPGLAESVSWARSRLRAAMQEALPADAGVAGHVLVALAVGDQAAIPAVWWGRFNRTGVGHLMSISGLHITMLAGLGAVLAGRLWSARWLARRMHRPLPARLPTVRVRWLAGLVVGFGYAALAGWGIPAQRTCWMLAAAGLAIWSGRGRSPVAVLSTAAAVVCVLDPWAPLAAGFWLSFAAVAAIIWHGTRRVARAPAQSGSARQRVARVLREALRSQVAATLSLLPLGAMFFSSVSLVSPVANAFAIPLVSAVITPLAMAGATLAPMSTTLASMPLWLATGLTEVLLGALSALDLGSVVAPTVAAPGPVALTFAVIGCAVLLAPIPLPGRRFAPMAFLPMLLAPPLTPADDELWLTALDVGQGTAVLVETSAGRLLYDTGPVIGSEQDAGSRVIAPYLRGRGIASLEALVISHEDTDHAGGALSVLRELTVGQVQSSLPAAHPVLAAAPRHTACWRDGGWRWGQMRFEWLHPGVEDPVPRRSPTNARSCVLRISGPAGSVLLAGDIEAPQERLLLAQLPDDRLRADVLLAPHHGSRTSSTDPFLDVVRPSLAIFQVGYRNRYRHPHPAVLERYRARSVGVLRSDAHGAIMIRMRAGHPPDVWRARVDAPRYWRIRLPALEGDPDREEFEATTVAAGAG